MKRKYVKPMIVLCLLAALALVGTLAYLTDVTDPVVNSFTVEDEVEIEINETDSTYTLTPGTVQDKDPAVTVVADESYVFIEVVETLPTAALASGEYTFADYVEYSINGLYTSPVGTAGGTVYLGGDDGTETDWYWMLVSTTTSDGTDTYGEDTADTYTTTTSVYALVDSTGALIGVSSLDTDGNGDSVDFPILADDEVSIPTTVTQEMLALFAITDGEGTTYSADLSFIGYAIQTEGLDELTSIEAIYKAAAAGTTQIDNTIND